MTLFDRVFGGNVYTVEYVFRALKSRYTACHIAFGIDNPVRPVAEEEFLLDIAVCRAVNLFRAELFEQIGNLNGYRLCNKRGASQP